MSGPPYLLMELYRNLLYNNKKEKDNNGNSHNNFYSANSLELVNALK